MTDDTRPREFRPGKDPRPDPNPYTLPIWLCAIGVTIIAGLMIEARFLL